MLFPLSLPFPLPPLPSTYLPLPFPFLLPPLTLLSLPFPFLFSPPTNPLLFYPIPFSPCLPSNSPSFPFLLSSSPFLPLLTLLYSLPLLFFYPLFPHLHFSIARKAKQINDNKSVGYIQVIYSLFHVRYIFQLLEKFSSNGHGLSFPLYVVFSVFTEKNTRAYYKQFASW